MLDIHMQNMDCESDTQTIALIYRINYTLMSTTLNPRAIRSSSKSETLLLEINHKNTNYIVLKILS